MSNTYNVGWLRDNENQIFIPFTYTKSVKLDDKGNTLDSTVNTVKEHGDVIADINATLEKIKNGEIHSGIADSTKGTLTLGNKKFNGSADITVEAKDLGITGALTYIGISTFPLTDKGIEKPYIDGKEINTATLEKGSVVLYSNNGEVYQEYLWTGTYWELLGDEGSYAYRSISIEAGAGLTGGGTLADNFSFSVVPDNNTTVIDDNNRVAMKQLSSAGTYGQSTNVQNLEPQSTNEFSVPYFTVDDYGRIISAQTKTIRIINDSAILDDIAQIKADIAGDDGATDNIVPRLAQVETRTRYINASSSEDDNIDESVFQITDDKGNIGVQVDNQGVKSFDFILTKTNTSLVTKLNELDTKDGELADNIKELKSYTLTAGAGLTGGGDLSTSREFHIGKGTGIQVNEDSIQLEAIKDLATGSYGQSTDYTSEFNGSFEIPHFTVDEFGRITSIKKVTINMPKDGEILDSIDELDDKLTKLIASTKEELQGNIDEVNNTLDGRITSIYNTLDDKIDSVKSTLDAKDTELADNLSTEIGAINETIAGHVTTLLNKIDENKVNIESNDQDIAALAQRVTFNEKDIVDINELNIEQSDQLARHNSDIDILDERTKNINASNDQAHNEAFYITDKDGNIGFSFDNSGFVKAPYDFLISDGGISLREIEGALSAEVIKRNKEIAALQEKDTALGDAIDAIADNVIVAGAGLILNNSGALSEESITISAQVDRGLDITDDKIGHTNSITAATISGTSGNVTTSITIPKITYDAQGHITKTETTTADLSSITDAIDELDENLNDRIDTLDDRVTSVYNTLDGKIDKTKTDLQKEIDDDVKVLADELRAKDQALEDSLTENIEAINTALKDTILDPLQAKIEANTDNIQNNKDRIDNLSGRITTCENDIKDINEINIQQSDLLVGHESDIDILQERTKLLNSSDYQDNFYITDENGNVSFQVDENGNISANKSITAEDFITHNNIKLSEVKSDLDQEIEDRTTKDSELSDAIDEINGKINKTVGTTTQPIYFNDGTPTACVDNFTFYQEIGADDVDPSTSSTFCVLKTGDTMSGPLISTGFIGPLTGTADAAKKLVDSNNQGLSLGSTSNPVYFNGGVPTACTGTTVPTGGSAGQILVKNSDGTSSWQKLVALPEGGGAGQVLVKNSTTDGDASWITQGLALTGDVSGSGLFDSVGNLVITTTVADDSHNHNNYVPYNATGNSDLNTIVNSGFYRLNSNLTNAPTSGDWGQLLVIRGGGDTITQIHGNFSNGNLHTRSGNPSDVGGAGSWSEWKQIWIQGNSVTGAVWNDYAECRESNCTDFGYVLMEVGDDSLTKTTERLSHFAGVSSDTWGFSQGETDKAKTPIAVAGRVLVYPYQDRNNYKPGDCVCAAPGGTVDIMTREEIINWPDRIVGTVSCVPQYEEWGGGEGADRDPVKVNGRIWIKVK